MNIVVTGSTGRIGSELSNRMEFKGLARKNADIECDIRSSELTSKITDIQPDTIIHLASVHANKCQENPLDCKEIVIDGTRKIVSAANKCNSHLIFMSSSHIFDGRSSDPYIETDDASPVLEYGIAKLKAEKLVKEANKWTIFRSAMVYGTGQSGPASGNFFNWAKNELSENNEVSIIMDQVNSPIYVMDLIDLIEKAVDEEIQGLFHTAGEGYLSRYTSIKILNDIFKLEGEVRPSSRSKIGWNLRGFDYSMDNSKIREHFGIEPVSFEEGVKMWEQRYNCR